METTLAAVNMTVTNNKGANLERIISFIEEAGDRGADILVLPESCLQGYIDSAYPLGSPEQIAQRRYFLQEAEAPNGSCLDLIGRACQRAGLYAQVGFIESTASKCPALQLHRPHRAGWPPKRVPQVPQWRRAPVLRSRERHLLHND